MIHHHLSYFHFRYLVDLPVANKGVKETAKVRTLIVARWICVLNPFILEGQACGDVQHATGRVPKVTRTFLRSEAMTQFGPLYNRSSMSLDPMNPSLNCFCGQRTHVQEPLIASGCLVPRNPSTNWIGPFFEIATNKSTPKSYRQRSRIHRMTLFKSVRRTGSVMVMMDPRIVTLGQKVLR